MRPFCRSVVTQTVSSLYFAHDKQRSPVETVSELLNPDGCVEFAPLFDALSCGKVMAFPCTIPGLASRGRATQFGGARREEGLMK